LESPALATIARAQRVEQRPAGAVILHASGTTLRFYVVLEGRVKLVRHHANGRELTLFLLGPGDGFDIISLLDGYPHDTTAQALDAVTTCSAPSVLWRRWLDENPAMRRAMLHYVAGQLRYLDELAGELAMDDTMSRLAYLLLRHFDDRDPAVRPNLIRDLSHEELAHLIGSVRVVVTRLLGRLRHAGVVQTMEGHLHVPSLHRLLDLAERHVDSHSDER
jgi:CRP-like cAMP-binding protein